MVALVQQSLANPCYAHNQTTKSSMKSKVRYVTTFNGDGTTGYRYQSYRDDGSVEQIYFTEKQYRSLHAAMAAAEAYSIEKNNGQMTRHSRSFDSRSPFEFCGVGLDIQRRKDGQIKTCSWVARYGYNKVSFNIRLYGYQQAFLNAAYERIRGVGVQPNLDPHSPPEPPEDVAIWLEKINAV